MEGVRMDYQSIQKQGWFGFVGSQLCQFRFNYWIVAISAVFAIEGHAQPIADSTVLTSYATNNAYVSISKSMSGDDEYVIRSQANGPTSQLILTPKNNEDWSHA